MEWFALNLLMQNVLYLLYIILKSICNLLGCINNFENKIKNINIIVVLNKCKKLNEIIQKQFKFVN